MNKVNKVTLLLRALVSAYILYLAYGLIKDYETASNQTLALVAIIVFVAGGGLIFAISAYKLIKKDYDDGSEEDKQPEAENVVDIENRQDAGQQEEQPTEEAGAQITDKESS